jgi:hypothetical protein
MMRLTEVYMATKAKTNKSGKSKKDLATGKKGGSVLGGRF